MIRADYHTHSRFSTDGKATLREQALGAIEKGLEILCITEHMDYDSSMCKNPEVLREYPDDPCPFVCNVESYYEEYKKVKAEVADRLDLRFGLELGLHPRLLEYYSKLSKDYAFDFLIGSSHEVYDMDPYFPEFIKGKEAKAAYREYFEYEVLCAKAMGDCFDVYGHLDYALRYNIPEGFVFNYSDYADILDELFKILIENGRGIEINTGGFSYFKNEPNPRIAILERYKQLGGEIITVGSDAHMASDIGRYFKEAEDILLGCGFKYYSVFKERKLCQINLT